MSRSSLKRLARPILLVALTLLVSPHTSNAAPLALPPGFTRGLIAQGLTQPTSFVFEKNGILVAEKDGAIQVVLPNGTLRAEPYLTLNVSSEKERGVLGLALHPQYRKKPFVYVYYTTGEGALNYNGTPANRVSRFRTVDGVGTSEQILLDNIPSDTGYHNGGDLEFGPDGMLYVSVGDGGHNWASGSDLTVLSGKILRVKPNGRVPKDNPFINRTGIRHETYAFGFRNPFRIAFRPTNDSLWAADVGYKTWEELDLIQPKGNYGWPTLEGPCPLGTICDPSQTNFGKTVPPSFYYDSSGTDADAMIGGVFASGTNYPPPFSKGYFFGDLAGWVRVLSMGSKNKVKGMTEFDTGLMPSQFRMGPDHNLYVSDVGGGKLYRYVYSAP